MFALKVRISIENFRNRPGKGGMDKGQNALKVKMSEIRQLRGFAHRNVLILYKTARNRVYLNQSSDNLYAAQIIDDSWYGTHVCSCYDF